MSIMHLSECILFLQINQFCSVYLITVLVCVVILVLVVVTLCLSALFLLVVKRWQKKGKECFEYVYYL